MKRAVFLDRDGVINRKAPQGLYITRWEEFQFLPGVAEAIALLNKANFSVFAVTNQRCVAKGLLTVNELESIHKRMCQELAAGGGMITEVYYCPHETHTTCSCRKPAPGMLLTAARAHEIDLTESWMIGDSDSDTEAGRKAGCKTVRISNGDDEPGNGDADILARSLLDAAHQVLAFES